MKTIKSALLMSAIGLAGMAWTVSATTYSGAGFSSLYYSSYYSGDAQPAVVGVTDVAQLYTADLSTAATADSPAVFALGPFGTLSSFVASYDLLSTGTTVAPYFILYMADDPTYSLPIVGTDSGSIATESGSINSSSLVHTGDLLHGSITLAALDATIDPNSGLQYGVETVEWAGLEIGNGGSGPGTANIESLTVPGVPDVASTMSLLGIGFGALVGLRRRLNRA